LTSESRPWSSKTGSIALETEPFVFFHPLLAGAALPGAVQPVADGVPLLEEEPGTWPQATAEF